jgi:inhibitor of cysteine peptidase
MMKRIYFLLIVTGLVISCVTLSPTPAPLRNPTSEPANTLPTATDPLQPITVQSGETFDIVLISNPSTGHHWRLINELDSNVLQLVRQDYIAQRPIMPGSGGVDVWTFSAVTAGEATIVLGHYPPANNAEPKETVTFTIHVE